MKRGYKTRITKYSGSVGYINYSMTMPNSMTTTNIWLRFRSDTITLLLHMLVLCQSYKNINENKRKRNKHQNQNHFPKLTQAFFEYDFKFLLSFCMASELVASSPVASLMTFSSDFTIFECASCCV